MIAARWDEGRNFLMKRIILSAGIAAAALSVAGCADGPYGGGYGGGGISVGVGNYWDPDSTSTSPTSKQENCNLPGGDARVPVNVDLAISDVFPASCRPTLASVPAPFADFFGPIQMFNFVVPAASQQQAISAEAAYFVFGFGSAS